MTEKFFLSLPRWQALLFKVIRHPWVYFLLTGPVLIVCGYYVLLSLSLSPVFLLGSVYGLTRGQEYCWIAVGLESLSLYMAAITPCLISHVNHAVDLAVSDEDRLLEQTLWSRRRGVHKHGGRVMRALRRSTVVVMPQAVSSVLLNLQLHMIHHLCPAVPSYRLAACYREAPEGMWSCVSHLSLTQALKTLRLVMWSSRKGRWISFQEVEH